MREGEGSDAIGSACERGFPQEPLEPDLDRERQRGQKRRHPLAAAATGEIDDQPAQRRTRDAGQARVNAHLWRQEVHDETDAEGRSHAQRCQRAAPPLDGTADEGQRASAGEQVARREVHPVCAEQTPYLAGLDGRALVDQPVGDRRQGVDAQGERRQRQRHERHERAAGAIEGRGRTERAAGAIEGRGRTDHAAAAREAASSSRGKPPFPE